MFQTLLEVILKILKLIFIKNCTNDNSLMIVQKANILRLQYSVAYVVNFSLHYLVFGVQKGHQHQYVFIP